MTRDELVTLIQRSFITHTNVHGYINMNEKIASNILVDIETSINIVYIEKQNDTDT